MTNGLNQNATEGISAIPGRIDLPRRTDWGWMLLGLLLIVVLAMGLRYGTDLLEMPYVYDERLMKVPVDDIVERGWSRETMLDYQEVKGPTFYWLYALSANVIGSAMNDLRLFSSFCFILSSWPLLLIARRTGVHGPRLILVAALYGLLPYHAVIGQMFMSEPSFTLIAMWMMWAFIWGFGESRAEERRLWGPVLVGILLFLLLHHRPHAVAFAGAVALVSFERDGWRSWPWWLACFLAGLGRLPLWWYWGGLVTSEYQDLFTLGFRLESQTYLLAGLLPVIGIFGIVILREKPERIRNWLLPLTGAGIGLLLALFFMPDLDGRVPYYLPSEGKLGEQAEYGGVVRTFVLLVTSHTLVQQLILTVFATLGGWSVGAMLLRAWGTSVYTTRGDALRLACWTLAVGVPLYIIAAGPVYDRYLMVWMILLPIAWIVALPRWAQLV
ncbi:MAG: hypothetical protein EA377_12385, partial [Phycisphaerales bacterium]